MATYTNFQAILQLSGGGSGTLATVLTAGNTTGGSDIIFSDAGGGETDRIIAASNPGGAGFDLNIDGSDAGAGVSTGGDINLTPGAGFGGGADGVVNINGDLVVTGTLSLPNLISGTGSPEGVTAAAVSTIYQRTDGGVGNSIYFKMSGAGTTGWAPAGPPVFEEFLAVGSTDFILTRLAFEDTATLGIENIAVFWNGVLQRIAAEYTVAFNVPPTMTTVTLTIPLTPGDFITIRYLPA